MVIIIFIKLKIVKLKKKFDKKVKIKIFYKNKINLKIKKIIIKIK
jgi:hypothetical protein